MAREEGCTLLAKLVTVGLLTMAIKVGGLILDYSIAWWLATAISLVLVFGGWLIFVDGD